MRKASTLGVVSAGLLLAGSPAHAVDTSMSSSLNIGIANGIQADLPIQIPVNACGNAIGLLGSAMASCVGGATANFASGRNSSGHDGYGGGGGPTGPMGGRTDLGSFLNGGIANGIQVSGIVQAPVNICGNAIGILASAMASCTNSGATANAFSSSHPQGHMPPHMPPTQYSSPRPIAPRPMAAANKALPSNIRTVAGKRAAAPHKKEAGLLAGILSPVTSLLGLGGGKGNGGNGGTCGDVDMSTFGNVGIANGIQAHVPVQVPINFSGNAIGILGSATASSVGGATANYCS
jgi:hypothetical protein